MALDIPVEIKNLIKRDNVTAETERHLRLSFYDDSIDSLYPAETLFPDPELYPANLGESWLVINDDQIVTESLTLEESLCSDDYLRFGACEAAKFEITVADVTEDIKNHWFTAELIIADYKLAFGIYKVDDVVIQKDKRFKKIIAYDRMKEFDTDVSIWYKNLSFPLSLREFRNSFLNYFGFPYDTVTLINDTMTITQSNTDPTINGRKVIESICEINGVFGSFDRTGTFKYVSLGYGGVYPAEDLFPIERGLYPGESADPEEVPATYKSLDYKEWVVESINRVNLYDADGELAAGFGDGENEYQIRDNFLIYGMGSAELLGIAENLYGNINGRTYLPATLELQALPYIEVGDLLDVEYSKGTIETFVMHRTTKGIQGMADTIESSGDQYQNQTYGIKDEINNIKSNVEKNKNEISGNGDKINRVDEYAKQVNSSLGQEVNRAKAAEGVNAQSITAETNRATKQEGVLSSRITDTAAKFERELSNLDTGLSTKITQTADQIRLEASDTKRELQASITVEAGRISSEVSRAKDAEGSLSSRITQTANSITSEVTRAKGAENVLSSRITQTESSITSTVKQVNGLNTKYSEVKQTADKISWVVSSGSSASNFTLTSRMANLISDKIEVKGYVTFSQVENKLKGSGTTTINGDNITTGRIDIQRLTSNSRPVITSYSGGIAFGNGFSYSNIQGSKVIIGQGGGRISFFGHTPYDRQSVTTPTTATMLLSSVQQLLRVLRNYGLIA